MIEFLSAIALLFSGEESYGRYLDLYSNHTAFCNIKNIGKRPTYLQYLDLLMACAADNKPVHHDLSKEARYTKDYETYAPVKQSACHMLTSALATSKTSTPTWFRS